MHVFLLTAEYLANGGDYTGHTSIHKTRTSAMHYLGGWLRDNDIDPDAAHYNATHSATSICNSPDPDTLGGIELHWSINKMEVQP